MIGNSSDRGYAIGRPRSEAKCPKSQASPQHDCRCAPPPRDDAPIFIRIFHWSILLNPSVPALLLPSLDLQLYHIFRFGKSRISTFRQLGRSTVEVTELGHFWSEKCSKTRVFRWL